MRFCLNFKDSSTTYPLRIYGRSIAGVVFIALLILLTRSVYSANQRILTQPSQIVFTHTDVVATVFWVGEEGNSDNGYIANSSSAWDGQWQAHFGGVDDPKNRNGFWPAGFTPKENPFYVALPYNDLTNAGKRKPTVTNCQLYNALKDRRYSWCKNNWLVIKHGPKVAYAQWEDVGPFGEDDTAYVFGSNPPHNTKGEKAGFDVSPALAVYLGLSGSDKLDWSFVTANSVPSGEWTKIITNSKGEVL